MARAINYEGVELPAQQIQAFREVLESTWVETLALPNGIREWNNNLLAITEKRRTIKNPDGTMRTFYSWCGDWVTYHLERAGCLHGLALNRSSLNESGWVPQMNLTWLRAWAGEPGLGKVPKLKKRFESDPSSALGPKKTLSWHAWDNKNDVCKDDYVPALGDLVILPRKNGDHIEFFVKRTDSLMTVSAGAQMGGTALITQRNLNATDVVGIIDISGLAPSQPF